MQNKTYCLLFMLISLLTALLLVGCNLDSFPGPLTDQQEVEPTEQEAEPTELVGITFTEEDGTATLHYVFNVDAEDGIQVSTDEDFTLWIFIDDEDPKTDAIMSGAGEGIQIVKVAALDQGVICWVTFKHIVSYDVMGIFQPSNCSFDITVIAKAKESSMIANSCSGALPLKPSDFFYPPPAGPHHFTGALEPVDLSLDARTKLVFTLSDVVVPESTGCAW